MGVLRSGCRLGCGGNGVSSLVVPAFVALGVLLGGCRCPHKQQEGPATQEAPAPEQSQTSATVQTPVTFMVQPAQKPKEQAEPVSVPREEVVLFDGQSLGQWKITDFGGQGDVSVKDGAMYLAMGNYMTGVTWSGPVVRMNYEISLEAMRVEGNDFFCGLTFPVGDSPCTLVLGGWGGSVCGLSSLDHYDASENETTRLISFEKGRWYKVRLRVLPTQIQAWLDDESIVDVDVTGRKIDIRIEVDLCQPLGIATYATTGAIRNIRLTKLPDRPQ